MAVKRGPNCKAVCQQWINVRIVLPLLFSSRRHMKSHQDVDYEKFEIMLTIFEAY